ncbi:MAG: hypothetical protein NVS3B23_05950 [Candidatus Saccharimonadales bacterium]
MALLEFPSEGNLNNHLISDEIISRSTDIPDTENIYQNKNESPWNFHTYVKDIIKKPNMHHESTLDMHGNTLTRYRVIMSDNSLLSMNICKPYKPVTDIPILETPAWWTGTRGFNEGSQRMFGSIGFPSIELGHVGEERDSWVHEIGRAALHFKDIVREVKKISLARQAHNMLSVLQVSDQFDLDPTQAFAFGNSRGAMTLLGLTAMHSDKNITIPFAMGVAPCFKKGFGKETLKDLSRQPGNEIINIGKIIAKNMFETASHTIETINLSPKSVIYELAHAPTIFRGDAGRFVPYIDKDQHMLLLAYGDDIAGQLNNWKDVFSEAEFPNVYTREVPGAHLSIADKRTREFAKKSFDIIGKQLKVGVPVEELDLSHVHRPLINISH